MFNFLHTFNPQPILFSLGPINIYWYGFFVVLGIMAALIVSLRLASYYGLKKERVFDLAFWLIIGGIIGARAYDIFLELPYYINHPWQAIKIWQGGLAIHGAVIAGIIIIYFFAKRHQLSFWRLSALMVSGLSLGQAIGRWGNYFNQELFGLPTSQPWGIPINVLNRPLTYVTSRYFQPTFLYESLGCLLIFITILLVNIYFIKKERIGEQTSALVLALYMILYSILRFFLEFIRIDTAPKLFGLRWPQLISLAIIIIALFIIIRPHAQNKENRP